MTSVYHYLTENCILSRYQSGFRSLHSTVTALLEGTDSWAMNIDRGFDNAVVFLDLKKAFDTVDHNILLTKLQFYGMRGFCHKWFTSYLSNRTQTCLMNSFMSTPKLVKCGVPQGTILGPLLFLLYMTCQSFCIFHNLECMQMTPASPSPTWI